MESEEYDFTYSMQKMKKLPHLIILERLFKTKEHYRFYFNSVLGILLFSFPMVCLIESIYDNVKYDIQQPSFNFLKFSFSSIFISLMIIIIYLSYAFLNTITSITMSTNMYNWNFRILGTIIRLLFEFLCLMRITIKANVMIYFIKNEYDLTVNEQMIQGPFILNIIRKLLLNNKAFTTTFNSVCISFEYWLFSNLLFTIVFLNKNPIIKSTMYAIQIFLVEYVKYNPLFNWKYDKDNKIILVGIGFVILTSLIHNIIWIYENNKKKSMIDNTTNLGYKYYLMEGNSVMLICSLLISLIALLYLLSNNTKYCNNRNDTYSIFLMGSIEYNVYYMIKGMQLFCLSNGVTVGKMLSEIALYSINKQFFCYSSPKYNPFIKVIGKRDYEPIN